MLELLQKGLCGKYYPESALHAIISYAAIVIVGYLLGSLNFGVIISRAFYKDDIRNHGSKGSGATNMLRTYGKLPAAMTFLGDGLKAALAVLVGALLLGHNPVYAGSYMGGLAAVIGHAYPVYYKFKGGKGVASAFFMIMCTSPSVGLICFAVFAIIAGWTKFVSLGSIMAVLLYPLILNNLKGIGFHNVIAVFMALLIIYLHRDNMKRIMAGTENKISFGGGKKNKKEKTAGRDDPGAPPE
jgi:glycerol-3-phosphate acyltransferase PlsY